MLEKNKESSEFATVIFSTIIYALLSLMISYNIIYAVYIAIFLLSLGMFFLVLLIMSKIIDNPFSNNTVLPINLVIGSYLTNIITDKESFTHKLLVME